MVDKRKVYIVGVGPGDYKLLTLRALEFISKADVIVYDRLVSKRILTMCNKEAEFIYVGKLPDNHTVPQKDINEILIKKALEGKVVARVKGGDPFVFGRGGEEAQVLFDNGIEFEIVPGVTSAVAVPAYAGIPVTHRDYCSSLHIITGHEKPGREESFINFEVIAKLDGTLVFLMGIKNLSYICKNLVRFGKSKDTPAAVVEKGTTSSQRVVTGTLENLAEKVTEMGLTSPAVTVIGGVVDLHEKLNWFTKKKLFGKRIVVTRAREQASNLVEAIESLGGEAIEFPTIKIEEVDDFTQIDNCIIEIENYNWLVFTSCNGVKAFFDRMKIIKKDIRSLFGIKLCAVGEATAKELLSMGLLVDFVPESFTTSDLLKGLINLVKPGEKVLLARADIASEELSAGLKESNIEFKDLTVYKTTLEASEKEEIIDLLEGNNVDFITFTSSSTVSSFVTILGHENINKLKGTKVVCIGPVTRETAEKHGLEVAAMADVYTIDGIVNKLVELCG
jgi:uroporphyrinogen III methyltransferase/synthase